MLCRECAADLPDASKFCLECGHPVDIPAEAEVIESAKVPQVRRAKSRLRVFLGLVLGTFLIFFAWAATSNNPYAEGIQDLVGWKHDQTILDTPFSVSAHNFRYYKFALPQGSMNVSIVGQFTASGGSNKSGTRKTADKGNDADDNVEVYVLSEPAFTVWQNGYATSSVYESGRVSQGTVQAELPAGAGIYYLVFSNKFAPKAAKNVTASVLLRYKNWVPESFRRGVDRFWNWLGL